LFLPEELRQSENLEEFTVVSGAITLSGTEGVLDTAQAGRYFNGSQQGAQIFSVDGFDLRSMQDNAILAGENIVVTSGIDQDGLTTFTITAGPAVITDAIVGAGTVTVASGTDRITVDSPPSNAIIGGTDISVVSGTNIVTINSTAAGAGLVGHIYNIGFTQEGSAGNKWLAVEGEDQFSNESPFIVPYNSDLIAITYSNKDAGTLANVRIFKSTLGDGNINSLLFTWQMNTFRRVAFKTDISGVSVVPGDKIGVFVEFSSGLEPNNPVFQLYFQITGATTSEDEENYSGNFE